ncbi:hypothetical protein GY45DRAFT_663304 [Cubamyces sp. BRFM 1775]|nr:hypothetical protein GY45DRAFT_663304 [Cubamyces sp. BRFM 1775]
MQTRQTMRPTHFCKLRSHAFRVKRLPATSYRGLSPHAKLSTISMASSLLLIWWSERIANVRSCPSLSIPQHPTTRTVPFAGVFRRRNRTKNRPMGVRRPQHRLEPV